MFTGNSMWETTNSIEEAGFQQNLKNALNPLSQIKDSKHLKSTLTFL